MRNAKKIAFCALFSLIFIFMLFVSLVLMRGSTERPNYYDEFSQHSSLTVNGVPIAFDDFSHLPNISLRTYDQVEFVTVLPDLDIYEPAITCYLTYAALEVFLDERMIYSHGIVDDQFASSVGAGHHCIILPSDFKTKELRIRITSLGDYKLSYLLRTIFLSDAHNVILPIIREHIFAFGTSISLILFGTMTLAIFLGLLLFNIDFRGLVYLSLLSFSSGLWGLSNMQFIRIFNDHLLINNYIRYFSFYFALFPWLFMVADLKKQSGFDLYFQGLKIIHVTFLCLVVLYDYFGIADYKSFLLVYDTIVFFAASFGLFVMGRQFKKQLPYEKFLFIGNIISVGYIFLQLIIYNLSKYFSLPIAGDPEALYTSFLISIATFLVSYGVRFSNTIAGKKEVELLHKMAYTDSMTGLENRQSGIATLKEYDLSRLDYHIVMLDLNNLKSVNDQKGHLRGDRMIVDFANCLVQSFPEKAAKCRLGGDEFMVVIPLETSENVHSYLLHLQEEIDHVNCTSSDEVRLETSYGIASTLEFDFFDYEQIMQAADQKMYRHKKQMKNLQPSL